MGALSTYGLGDCTYALSDEGEQAARKKRSTRKLGDPKKGARSPFWDQMLNGERHVVREADHGTLERLRSRATNVAVGRRVRVSVVRVDDEHIAIQLVTWDGPRRSHAAARKLGMPPDEFARRTDAGEAWCGKHKCFHPAEVFGRDASRASGRSASCRSAEQARRRESLERKQKGTT